MIKWEFSRSDFREAIQVAQHILNQGFVLTQKQSLLAEAEQLVLFAYFRATGNRLKRTDLYFENGLFPEKARDYLILAIEMRVQGKPLQHITQSQYFLNHEYQVSPDVLIPRPETEILVEAVFEEFSHCNKSPKKGLEIGIGSGILSIELLAHYPELSMVASERSLAASKLAEKNACQILGQGWKDRLEIIMAQKNTEVFQPFEPLSTELGDFLISNPPYLKDPTEVETEVLLSEPSEALFSPTSDPLFFYREIANHAREYLVKDGMIFVEIAHERADETLEIFEKSGMNAKIRLDLNQRRRVLVAQL